MPKPTCLRGGHWDTGNLIVTPIECVTGTELVEFHDHEIGGHTFFCLQGSFRANTEDPTCGCKREKVLTAFSHVWIPAGVKHSFTPLEENSKGICVFIKGEFDEGVEVVKDNGWGEMGDFNIEK